MKKYEVIADFIDKNTKVKYVIGTGYPAPNARRAKELIKGSFIQEMDGDNDESGKVE